MESDVGYATVISFLRMELATVPDPRMLGQSHVFTNLAELTQVFIMVLQYDDVDPIVKGLGPKILGALHNLSTPDAHSRLKRSLEELSTGFESFLKTLGFLRYRGDTVRTHGDGARYAGLLNTSLGGLLSGKVGRINPGGKHAPDLLAPLVSFSYGETDLREAVYNRARLIRNDIHTAPVLSITDTWGQVRLVLAALFFSLEENLPYIRAIVDPLFSYLSRVRDTFQKWERKYVELTGEPFDASNGINILAGQSHWTDESAELLDELLIRTTADEKPPTGPTSVLSIPRDFQRWWLIGEPGAGKSTTLQRMAGERAAAIIRAGYVSVACPVIVAAGQLNRQRTLMASVEAALRLPPERLHTLLTRRQLWILIDGINEIIGSDRQYVYSDIKHFLTHFDFVPVVLTSRKYKFNPFVKLPAFELRPLTDELILDYLGRNLPAAQDTDATYDNIRSSSAFLLEIARNPLMLQMLQRVVRDGSVPKNRGQLFRNFTRWTFSREQKTSRTSLVLRESLLSIIGFGIRQAGGTYADQAVVLRWIENALGRWRSDSSVDEVYDELLLLFEKVM